MQVAGIRIVQNDGFAAPAVQIHVRCADPDEIRRLLLHLVSSEEYYTLRKNCLQFFLKKSTFACRRRHVRSFFMTRKTDRPALF